MEPELQRMGFHREAIEKQGYTTWLTYERPGVKVEFACGPAEYHIEMFVRVGSLTYELADLMKKKRIAEWVYTQKLRGSGDDPLPAEAEWFVALLREVLLEL